MWRYLKEPKFEHGALAKIGILLVNLGTPERPTPKALRAYLKQFLSDPRVVEIARPIWLPILHGIILNTRPRKSAAKYAKIWTDAGSPLKVHTEQQTKLLRGFLGERSRAPLAIAYGMRYGSPSIASALAQLKAQQCDRVLLLPLYPQYAASSTGSACDAFFDALKAWRNMPAVRVLRSFHDHPGYIAALAQSVREHWQRHERGDKLVMSFHGVPRFALDKGDPYHCQCQKTGRLLAQALALNPEQYEISFQSRFGRTEWLKPYTSEVLSKLGKQKLARVDVICPGFVSDCLETLEEIAMEGKAAFLNAGGKEFHYIACLNERDDWLQALCAISLEQLQGWAHPAWDEQAATAEASARRHRAQAMGASA